VALTGHLRQSASAGRDRAELFALAVFEFAVAVIYN